MKYSFSYLCELKGMWFKTLIGFIPDRKLTNPTQLISISGEEMQPEQVLYDVAYYNGY